MAAGRALTAAAGLALLAASCGRGASPPTIVLISLDSVRADALTFADEAATPHLAALARRGTVFDGAVAGSSWTLPTHLQMLTGEPPALHGVQLDDVALDPGAPTVAELLSRSGWFTAGVFSGWYLSGEYGFARGFDVYSNALTGGEELEAAYAHAVGAGDLEHAAEIAAGRRLRSHADVSSPAVVRRVREVLRRVGDQPLFLFVHLFDPHYDYVPPEPWDTRFDPEYAGALDGRGYFENRAVFDTDRTPARQVSDRDLEHLVALYRGELGWTDQNVGEILDELAARGRLDGALVVVTADHGEEFFEHGGRGHRHTLYDELLRVPLLVVPPRGSAPAAPPRHAGQVGLSDLVPTLLEHAGLATAPNALGRSLLPVLRGEPRAARPELASLIVHAPGAGGLPKFLLKDALRTEREKLVRTFDLDEQGALSLRLVQYYDLVQDPREQAGVTDADDPRVRRLWEELERELEVLRKRWSTRPRVPDAERATQARELFRHELAGLGYAGGGDELGSPSQSLPWGLAPFPRFELPAPAAGN